MKRAFALLPLLAGCDVLFQLRHVPDASFSEPSIDAVSVDAPERCPYSDNFDDGQLSSMWNVEDPTHASVLISEQGGHLDMAVMPNIGGYNALQNITAYRATGRTIEATLYPMSEEGYVETYLSVAFDPNNSLFIQTGAGNIAFGKVVAGQRDNTSIPYVESQHRHWRFRHDAVAGLVYFETAAEGAEPRVYSVRRTIVAPFSFDAIYVAFIAGTYQIGNPTPGSARYDDFAICDPAN